MKVFVGGASGAIGRPLVKPLVTAGHEVVGMTTSIAGVSTLRNEGADGVVLNVLDAGALAREIERIRPDAIIDELTSLPKRYTPDEMRAAAPRDRQVRLDRSTRPTSRQRRGSTSAPWARCRLLRNSASRSLQCQGQDGVFICATATRVALTCDLAPPSTSHCRAGCQICSTTSDLHIHF
jgi:hypothetical protein